ncbi:uncharacterized protein C19orf44 homolog isoform X2 [Pseudoliparis swirei]|uniref:uncharacterized protein C19orf44 homolog isoform X2 n=1 Tax=Pseudoliparis swirei TaxID=2059687 RepID=UPI0024BE4B27|nr:uncharacterized protein C19orf44 homolog isoform X2 [Pseudoliparis swirei]
MWKQGARSSALDRAQALLSAKKSTREEAECVRVPTGNTGAVGGSLKTKPASLNTRPVFSDLSDLSSVSSAPEPDGGDRTQARNGLSSKGLRPQSSPGEGGSRFLKKAPLTPIISDHSPVSKSQVQRVPEHRYRHLSSSQQGSQAAALSKLAQIESRVRSRKQVQGEARRGPQPAENQTSGVGISPPLAALSLEAPVQLSAQSSGNRSLKGIRFLKNKAAVTVNDITTTTAAAGLPKGGAVGVRSGSRATKSLRVVSGVSLESDEEDMRKLLGESLDSVGDRFLPGRPSSMRTADERVHSSPPPAAVAPSSCSDTAPPHYPASPSPFRFAGQTPAHFSPSLFSPSPSPPRVSPSPRVGSPQCSLSSASGRGAVLSLEELFSEEPHSEISAATSDDFKINVMTLDDLGFTERTPSQEREVKLGVPPPGSPNGHLEPPRLKEKKEERRRQGDDVSDYRSDFESGTEPDDTVSQVSEHLQGDGDEEEVASEVREEASQSAADRVRTEYPLSDTTSRSCTSDYSQKPDSRASVSPGSRTLSRQSRRRASTRKVFKETAVQTQPDPLAYTWPAGVAALGPAVGMTYLDPTPLVAHSLSAEMVEALSISNPAVFALNEMLKQQLAMTRRFIESRRQLHSSLVQSLGPPNYRYTTLEDTKEIRKHRPPPLKMEAALEEVLQEMRDFHHI